MNIPIPQPKRKPVPEHVKSAIKHYAENSDLTQKRIAELTGVSERSVYRVLSEAGLLTHLPRMTKEAADIMQMLKTCKVDLPGLHKMLCFYKDGPSREQILKKITDMEDGTWASLLKDIVTARVAKSHNVGVSTAMLNIQNAVDKNAKPGNN